MSLSPYNALNTFTCDLTGRVRHQGISSIISQADVSLWLSSPSLSDPAVLLATLFSVVFGLVYMAKGSLTFGFTRRRSREDSIKDQSGDVKALDITSADATGSDKPRQARSTERGESGAKGGGGGGGPSSDIAIEAVRPAGQSQGQQKEPSKWASTVSTLSEKSTSMHRSHRPEQAATVGGLQERYGARDGVVGLDVSASPVKLNGQESRHRQQAAERQHENPVTLTHEYSLPEDNNWEEDEGEGEEEFRLFSEEEEAMLAAAGDTPGRTGDDSIEALLLLLIAVENEGQRIEAKMRRIK
jgi:hypothetical protein